VKKILLITGVILILFGLLGYYYSPSVISDQMNKLMGGNASDHGTSSLLSQMGIPPIETIIKLTEYSFLGLGFAGFGLTIFGTFAKNIKKQILVKPVEANSLGSSEPQARPEAVWVLQERLARGEISSIEYKNLKRLMEE
jgi:uncharacterized membrane protein